MEESSGLESDELIPMDLDEQDCSDLEDDDDELDDPISSPFLLSLGPVSTETSVTSSPPNNDDTPQPFSFSGKPINIKRGRGRPRRESGQPIPRVRGGTSGIPRVRKPRPAGFARRGSGRYVRHTFDKSDFDVFSVGDEFSFDSDLFNEKLFADEPPYFPEHWPGKVCAFCNLGERSQLGQGDMLRLNCPEDFSPQKLISDQNMTRSLMPSESNGGDRSPRGPVTCRRQKGLNKCRHPSATSEYIDELTIIGYVEVPDISTLFEPNGQFYVHRSCALWSSGVTKADNSALQNVGPVVLQCSSKKCSFCNHYGASLTCNSEGCYKIYHFPCATAAGAFQEFASLTTFCSSHLGHVPMLAEASACYTCKILGDVANLMFCSSCGTHYHGMCIGLAQTPGVRSGWQCRKCRLCQVCRMTGDETKLMSCEQCDKVYHASCQRPIVTAIPKYGWKCRCCRICGDCGARTPGAGLSSRWHSHYTVCDSCYQQRNKGFSCPLCHRAYRAHAHREMVQCTMCRKFVHGTCDPDADLVTYHQKKEANPEYEYMCLPCKNLTQAGRQAPNKRSSMDDSLDFSTSQDSLYEDNSEFDIPTSDEFARNMGLSRGKPYNVTKVAKKRLGFSVCATGRTKVTGKSLPGKVGYMKRTKLTEFGRKRGHKTKMRGVFGVPGVGLQKPVSDGKNDDEPGVENRLVLCSSKDKFILTQDICVMCGSLGTDQEGCLISCVQCGQCYHPYCVNVKITKVILQKGWRCLDCTVCEGCGHRDDDARLILCDDCDVSYHIYCTRPPLTQVPTGTWRCSSCARCEQCGSTDPGFNCTWMGGWRECGPCASRTTCPVCTECYCEGELIIQCVQCERWLHGSCDLIKTEEDAERCAEEGYCCTLCRPRDVPPPHLMPVTPKLPPISCSPPETLKHHQSINYYVDGVYLSERGNHAIKAAAAEHQSSSKKKRRKLVGAVGVQDKEAGIMATIESVVSGRCSDNALDDGAKLDLVDVKEEPQELFKEGMIWTKGDGPPPEGFTVFAMETGVCVLRRKRQRNLQKLGIGGFLVRVRGFKNGQDNDDIDILPGQTNTFCDMPATPLSLDGDKPKKKTIRRKPKSKLTETFPLYLQEAFFGKDLMDIECKKNVESCSSDEDVSEDKSKSINLSQDELIAVAAVTAKQEIIEKAGVTDGIKTEKILDVSMKEEEEEENTEDLKDVLPLSGDLLDPDLVNSIINDDDDELTKNTESIDSNLPDSTELADTIGNTGNSKDNKDELSDILGPNFNLDSMHIPNINSKDVEDLFKGVLTDESQESQENNTFPLQGANVFANATSQLPHQTKQVTIPPVRPQIILSNLNSPASFPPPSPYHSEYSNSPQFSPAFSEPRSPWVGVTGSTSSTAEAPDVDSTGAAPSTYNQRSSEKMRADEGLGKGATISAVLYANMNHPEWQTEFPNWSDRYKQIIKKWKTLSQDQRAPYLQHARDNRSQLRMKKQQQDQEKIALQQKSAREAEQERQWKQLQAIRQQQAQQQQHVIQEQRVQAIARVHRQISTDPNQSQFSLDQQSPLTPLPPPTSQEQSPVTSPSPTSSHQHFLSGLKSPLSWKEAFSTMRSQTPAPESATRTSPVDGEQYQHTSSGVPKGTFQAFSAQQQDTVKQAGVPGSPLQGFLSQTRSDQADVSNQLRDLLQKQQQFKKLDELLPGKTQQRVWPSLDQQESEIPSTTVVSAAETTFRQPLPPSVVRPKIPIAIGNRPLLNANAMRLGPVTDARIQGLDPRMRLILQQQQRLVQASGQGHVQQQFIRLGLGVRPTSVEQYEQLLQRQTQAHSQTRVEQLQATSRVNVINQASVIQRPVPPSATQVTEGHKSVNEEGIPDNVTAELEKLEQETGTMVELQGVSDILGGLGEDDDELLAEMGADFNILEYADPELEAITGGKTNIFDLELEEEPVKKENRDRKIKPSTTEQQTPPSSENSVIVKKGISQIIQTPEGLAAAQPSPQILNAAANHSQNMIQRITTSAQQQQTQTQHTSVQLQSFTPQQIHQQMLHQVQQAAAQGRPMPPGSKMQAPDGIIGIVTHNNTVQLQIPQNYQQKVLLQLQNQKLHLRLGQANPRPSTNQVAVSQVSQQGRLGVGAPPQPPPPPYPGPPPPYPGSTPQQQPEQEQPLLLEDLLEQEKREQEKLQTQSGNHEVSSTSCVEREGSLLTDQDFERLKADVFNSGSIGMNPDNGQATQQSWQSQPHHQQSRPAPPPTPQSTTEITTRVQMFNANLIPAPPLPPEDILTEQDKQTQMMYEQWLNHQNSILSQQLRFYETEVQKLRKNRKSLNSKQRQLRKSGNTLTDTDATELQRITAEQAILQKHLESSRKQSRQHGMLIQEYRTKQQSKPQKVAAGQSPCLQSPLQQIQSPLGPHAASPMTSQSPLLSPSPSRSPLTQHTSPMHSPGPIISPSPGAGTVQGILQSPSSMAGNNMSPMQPSPRIGTPHSQSEGSPGQVQSPSQVCLPPPVPRMTSPQHRRVVTSPNAITQMRLMGNPGLQQRVRLQSPMSGFQQKAGASSPLSSPTSQPLNISHNIQLQKQLQHQVFLQQQQSLDNSQVDPNLMHSQRGAQLLQHRNLIRQQAAQQQQSIGQQQPLTPQQHQILLQQKQLAQQQQQQQIARFQQQQAQNNPPHSPMPPKSPMINQQIMSPHSMPPSPMPVPPKSPMVSSLNSNQQNPNSPVARSPAYHQGLNQPPNSPMTLNQYQPPVSPMPRSPMLNPIQSPHGGRRPTSANNSPANPDRPHSVENPGTPRTPYSIEHLIQDTIHNQHNNQFFSEQVQSNLPQFQDNPQSGGGNPNSKMSPIPLPPHFQRFGYFKLGLRGGAPMWNYGRGAKRIPSPPSNMEKSEDKVPNPDVDSVNKMIRESHLNKVSILKRRSPATNLSATAGKGSSLVSTDYNDDSSCTPPVTPPPIASSPRVVVQAAMSKKESKDVILHSPDDKQMNMMDYDDDNNTVLSAEVSLSSVAQQNDEEMVEIDTLSQPDLAHGLSSPLESDQIADEYLLFPGNMVVDSHYSDKEEEVEEEYVGGNMHIVIRSPTTSDDEFIMQGKTKKYNIVPHTDILNITETPESPEHEEVAEPSPELEDEMMANYDDHDMVIVDPNEKSPEESISTKEDFEELIDKGSRKENVKKHEEIPKHINDFQKYANIFNYAKNIQHVTSSNNASIISNVTQKMPQKMSLMSSPVVQNLTAKPTPEKLILTQNAKVLTSTQASKVTSIILTHNSTVRSNVLSVPKLVNTVSPAITIVGGSTSKIASILPSKFSVPVISASAVRQLSNVKVIDKPSSSLSLSTHDSALPNKIFEDDSVSPDSSVCEDDKSKDSSDEKSKTDSPPEQGSKTLSFVKKTVENPLLFVTKPNEIKPQNTGENTIKHIRLTNVITKDRSQKQRVPSPVTSKASTPVVIHNTPELKMTAQVIQETQAHMQITATEAVHSYDGTIDDTKSVVISIPSPTPSQEQMLDNIAFQALENRRRELESFEDVLDMIENITAEPPAIQEEDNSKKEKPASVDVKDEMNESSSSKVLLQNTMDTVKFSPPKSSTVPQLSPLSQPTELTTNMANASQQLRTLLSSLQTTSTSVPTNVESVVKNFDHKIVSSSSSPIASQPLVASQVMQQSDKQSQFVTNVNTVIVPNLKQKIVTSSINLSRNSFLSTQTLPSVSTSTLNFSQSRPSNVQLISAQNKMSTAPSSLNPSQQITSVITAQLTNTTQKQTTTSNNEEVRKPSLTLTAMLQNQPAATPTTNSSPDSITAASLLGSPLSLSRTGFTTSLVQAHPNAAVTLPFSTISSAPNLGNNSSVITTSNYRPAMNTTNLLHTQLTKVSRTSQDDLRELKIDEGNQDPVEGSALAEENNMSASPQELSGCKHSNITMHANRMEDSQNVLLKKLLQNTACASIQSPPPVQVAVSTVVAPTPIADNLKSTAPTLSSLLPPVIKSEHQPTSTQSQTVPKPSISRIPIRETSFVSNPTTTVHATSQFNITSTVATQQLHIDVKKCLPPSRTPSRDDLLSPQTPKSTCSQDSSLQTPPLSIKKEMIPLPSHHSSPVLTPQEVKREFIDESSQHSTVSDQSRPDIAIKEEILETLDTSIDKTILDKEELKKQKRRMYNQKRRQNQILNKELGGQQPKKRPRKNSKLDEDYDTYIDSVLSQLRQLPPMTVSEPVLSRNYGIIPIFGSGDMSKIGTRSYSSQFGELTGCYGNAELPGSTDFYNTDPYGDLVSLPEKPPTATQRFYDQEFPLIRFDTDEEKKRDLFCREDTPDSVISTSSPECVPREPLHRFMGLKLISDDDDEGEEGSKMEVEGRLSPVVPVIKPTPIRMKPAGGMYLKDYIDNKENIHVESLIKSKIDSKPPDPVTDNGNVTVTLTLTSSAAEDIMGVLRDLANILHIPAPTSYQIVERTTTPPSQKLGLYRTKGKDGKEGAPIDIQSILNGAAKFCKHCDVVILNNMIKKKVSEFPFLTKDSELSSDGEELYFCSSTCYTQFAVMHRSPFISEDKAAAIIDHLSQKDNIALKLKKPVIEAYDHKSLVTQQMHFDHKDDYDLADSSDFTAYFHRSVEGNYQDQPDFSSLHSKVYKNIRYKYWSLGCLPPVQKHKKPTDKELMEMLYRMQITITPSKIPDDTRKCMFCQLPGDSVADGPARLLNVDVDKWVHLNCALWSDGVYETVDGALMNIENALQISLTTMCIHCNKLGATIRCFKTRCSNVYHLGCAVKEQCIFYKNKTIYCSAHVQKNEKDNELTTLSVWRRVYINRDENRQVAAVMHHSDTNNLLRVGSLIFLNVGQLLPHQLQNFHTVNYIYPIGYKIIRFFWSMRRLNKRCRYICSIHDAFGKPEFRILIQEQGEEDLELKDATPKSVWQRILDQAALLRRDNNCLQMFPKYTTGEDLFGLTEPAIVRVLESLPGIETLTDYKFKYGRNPLLELPLAINPSGAARTEPRLRNQLHWKRPHTQRTTGATVRPLFGPSPSLPPTNILGEISCPYSKQFVHSKSSQYKKMKQEWRNNVYLARSKIQGLGLYAARDLEKHTMVIEYIGEIIRTELAECREKQYEAKNRGIYMFRLDEERVVDATLSGGLARYINHSCNPNCVAETVEVERDVRIIIFSKRRIQRGEELSYDYKFDIEDDQHKISCMCGAPNCRKWMN